MLYDKSRRGRPKGSGIDDTTRLETIAELLAANPSLKPTTAIKSIGITDPSAIRRLRDKFHEFTAAQTTELKPVPARPAAPALKIVARTDTSPVKSVRARAVPASGPTPARKVEPAAVIEPAKPKIEVKAEPAPVAKAAPAAAAVSEMPPQRSTGGLPKDPTAWLVMCTGLGVRFATAAIEAQFTFGAQLMRAPPLAMAIRSQLAFNEIAMSMLAPRTAPIKSN